MGRTFFFTSHRATSWRYQMQLDATRATERSPDFPVSSLQWWRWYSNCYIRTDQSNDRGQLGERELNQCRANHCGFLVQQTSCASVSVDVNRIHFMHVNAVCMNTMACKCIFWYFKMLYLFLYPHFCGFFARQGFVDQLGSVVVFVNPIRSNIRRTFRWVVAFDCSYNGAQFLKSIRRNWQFDFYNRIGMKS